MKQVLILIAILAIAYFGYFIVTNSNIQNNRQDNQEATVKVPKVTVHPISHASMVLEWADQNIYADPVGDVSKYEAYDSPDLILITDIHGDHLNVETLEGVVADTTQIIAPEAVYEQLSEGLQAKTKILKNSQQITIGPLTIQAIPMYNLPESEDSRHTKGRGNGYVLDDGQQLLYIAGDTAGIPEMRSLENIEYAFIPMNLPYTMSVEEAAEAVLVFAPTFVYPYHYRGTDGLSDVAQFKELVETANEKITVVQLDWYPE